MPPVLARQTLPLLPKGFNVNSPVVSNGRKACERARSAVSAAHSQINDGHMDARDDAGRT